MHLLLAPLALSMAAPYDLGRGLQIVKELAARSVGVVPTAAIGGGAAAREREKAAILEALRPYGDPALNVPAATFEEVDASCRRLERLNPASTRSERDAIAALQGAWRVRYSNSPPPSNGALGPLRGEALQVVDVERSTYTNELSLFNGLFDVKLSATFRPKPRGGAADGTTALRVSFKTIAVALFGLLRLPPITFPEGTERTWLLTYTDEDTRIVRAGVDGGRSTARDVGLLDKEEGEAADSYLFVLTRDPAVEAARAAAATAGGRAANPLAQGALRASLKAELLDACAADARFGADTDAAGVARIEALMDELSLVNPTRDPASSPKLCGRWDIVWTTESELLALMSNPGGFFGLPCTASYQVIARERADDGDSWEYALDNAIDFDGGDSFLRVGSSCAPAASGGKVSFSFKRCDLKWRQLQLPLPPVGSGFFEVLYLDDDLRVCKDSRGDLQICRRASA